jgi:2-iminobutanoate/2-iminopropanoate deaminase
MADLPFSPYRESKDFVFLSGKIELTSEGKLLDGSVAEKTAQTMKNVLAELKNAGLDVSNIVMAQVFLTDMNDYTEFNEEYVKHLRRPYPARFVVSVKELPLGAKVEVAVVASKK